MPKTRQQQTLEHLEWLHREGWLEDSDYETARNDVLVNGASPQREPAMRGVLWSYLRWNWRGLVGGMILKSALAIGLMAAVIALLTATGALDLGFYLEAFFEKDQG